MKFAKPFLGVPDGEVYPVQYVAGDECPPELEASALALDTLDAADAGADGQNEKMTVAQLRDELTARGISFEPNAKKVDLLALLNAAS